MEGAPGSDFECEKPLRQNDFWIFSTARKKKFGLELTRHYFINHLFAHSALTFSCGLPHRAINAPSTASTRTTELHAHQIYILIGWSDLYGSFLTLSCSQILNKCIKKIFGSKKNNYSEKN